MLFAESCNQVADLDDLFRVKTDGRFIENEHIGIADERLGDTDALAIAFGKMADRPLIHVLDADDFTDLAQMCLAV